MCSAHHCSWVPDYVSMPNIERAGEIGYVLNLSFTLPPPTHTHKVWGRGRMSRAEVLKMLTAGRQQVRGRCGRRAYHCRVSCVCFFLSRIICVTVLFWARSGSAAGALLSWLSESSSSEEKLPLLKCISGRKRNRW